MDGRSEKLNSFLDTGSTRFIIPVYQRNYDWGTSQCKRLYDDLIKIIKNKRKSHFFGSIVSSVNDSGVKEFLIIDGQQRLTTISLLLLAIYKNLKNGNVKSEDSNLEKRIYNRYLTDEYAKNPEDCLRLKPVKKDQKAYMALFSEQEDIIENSNITINFNYFYKRIQEEEISIDELFYAFNNLEIINIELKSEDNPQMIFESLNSTGLALKEGDKIRNFILMDANHLDQDRLYNKYWAKIELLVEDEMDRFIRDYISAKTRKTPAFKRIYEEFKEYVYENKIEKEDLLKDILLYAKNYNILLTSNIEGKLSPIIKRLNKMETKVTRPFFMEMLKAFNEKKLSENTLIQVFETIENYIFRRNIVELPTNALNKIFLTLFNEVLKIDGSFDNYINKLNFVLLKKNYSGRFPNDEEFIEKLSKRPIYQMKNNMLAYIMERFENRNSKEDKDIYRHLEDGNYSIEHIMPQTLNKKWKEDLGEDYENIHKKWIHRLSNLTLTAYNSRYSNSDFETKKTIENGYIDSGIRMNQYIGRFDKWTKEELEKRNNDLMNLALDIWPDIESTYKIEKIDDNEVGLGDDIDLTGAKIKSYIYDDQEIKVKNWVNMYTDVVNLLFDENSSIIVNYATNNNSDNRPLLSFNKDDLLTPQKINENIYLDSHSSTNGKIRNLKKLFDLYDYDYSRLSFKIL